MSSKDFKVLQSRACNSHIFIVFAMISMIIGTQKGYSVHDGTDEELVVPQDRRIHFKCRIILVCHSESTRCGRVARKHGIWYDQIL